MHKALIPLFYNPKGQYQHYHCTIAAFLIKFVHTCLKKSEKNLRTGLDFQKKRINAQYLIRPQRANFFFKTINPECVFIRYSRVCNQDALIGKRKYLLLSLKNLFISSCEILRIKVGWTSLPSMINRKFIFLSEFTMIHDSLERKSNKTEEAPSSRQHCTVKNGNSP